MLAIMMCAASLTACGEKGNEENTTTVTTTAGATTASSEVTTYEEEPKTETTTEKTTEKTTEATTTEDPGPAVQIPEEGLLVYYEDFNSYANNDNMEDVLKQLGWTRLTKEANGVYNESDGTVSIVDGRLYADNYDTDEEKAAATENGGTARTLTDGYFQIDLLNDEYMMPVVMGKYTLQYEVEYEACSAHDRYLVIITECSSDGQCYNSFHLRCSTLANHQCHFYGSWKTYSAYDAATDLNPASSKDDGTTGTPIITKLFGYKYEDEAYKSQKNLIGIKVTIKLQWDPERGHDVYLKTDTMTDFVKVSTPSDNADGIMYLGWEGYAVQFKFGGKMDGYVDNIAIWTGWGEQPSGTTITYKPAA